MPRKSKRLIRRLKFHRLRRTKRAGQQITEQMKLIKDMSQIPQYSLTPQLCSLGISC